MAREVEDFITQGWILKKPILIFMILPLFKSSGNQDETLPPRQCLTSAPYAMNAAKSADADTLGGEPSAYYAVATEVQKRIEGKCAPGNSVREINSDGSKTLSGS